MDFQSIKRSIENKIKNKQIDFTDEEVSVFTMVPDLEQEFIKVLEDKSVWNKEYEGIINALVESLYDSLADNRLAFKNFIYFSIENNPISKESLKYLLELYEPNKNEYESFMEYHEICFKRKLKDETYTFENMFNPNEEEIISLLKAGKFMPIKTILKDTNLSPNVLAAFRKYYDFEHNPLPICLYKYLDQFSDLVNEIYLSDLLEFTNYDNSGMALGFFIQKLEEKKVIINVDSSIRSKMIVNKATKERITKLSNMLMEYGIFDFVKIRKNDRG